MTILRSLIRAALVGALLLLPARAAEPTKPYDLPAGDAAAMLKQFSEVSGRETLFAASTVRGIQTHAVKGELTADEALARMLDGTGLTAVPDAKTGAFAVKGAVLPNGQRAAPRIGSRPEADNRVEPQMVRLSAVEVTGTRLRGLLAGATAQPVLALDSKEIERTGAQSLGDLFRYIPQVSSFTTGQSITRTAGNFVAAVGGPTSFSPNYTGINASSSSRTSATLRGSPGDGTLLLVDGRRVPKNNQSSGGDGYDLNGIPLAAIERVEVLLDGASSIYGADAIGGVINVILKKNYRGSELRVGYENTFDKDAGVLTTSLTHGFAQGPLRGLVALSWEKANAMALRDRWFTASYDRRPFGGADLRGAVVGGAGRVSRTGTVALPGLTSTSAAVPTGNLGTGLTVADYANAGAISDPADLAAYQDFSSSYLRRSAVANLSYELRKSLEFYTELRAAQNENRQAPQPVSASTLSIPAGYPGNPFGIAIQLSKYFYDVMPVRVATDDTLAAVLGVRGELPREWHYDASVNYVRGHTKADSPAGPSIVAASLTAAIASGLTPNLFYDSTRVRNPNGAGVIESLTAPAADEEISQSYIYSLQVDGPVYTLPAGKVAVAAGTEYREEYTDFPRRLATDTSSAQAASRDVAAFFGEFNVPVFGPSLRLPLVEQLNLSGSIRREHYSDGGSSSDPRAGVAWRPASWLLLRGSYGEGFKVPNLYQTKAPIRTGTQRFSGSVDPLRGNEAQTAFVATTSGGNPDLRPEKSENTTFGAVLEIPRIKGLSFSFDHFDNRFVDRIGSVTFEQRVLYFPERITRGASLPTDQAGWPGPITGVDTRLVNVAYSDTTGYDVSARYDTRTPYGELLVNVTGTKYTRNSFVPAPNSAPAATVNTDSLPVQFSGSAFLTRGAWGTGALVTYRGGNRSSTTVIATGSAIRWDWQLNYDFTKAEWLRGGAEAWYGKAFRGLKASLTIFNVCNTRPPFDNLYMPDNTVLDARLRRYGISVRKQF